jgi:acyl transferase domain-containing protein/NAD(P)H-dependent flavin oxidoreductase YrpB (nitropropane dioxygenase family)
VAAGAAGVVLDGAMLLSRESALGADWRERIARLDGSETVVVGPTSGPALRVFALPGSEALARLRRAATEGGARWRSAVRQEVGWGASQCLPIGQDAALAHRLALKFVTAGGIVQSVERSISDGIAAARVSRPIAEGSPLAIAHGTRYPILQGPMTRVSDVAAFAEAIARDGGLPFLALALSREAEVRTLLRDTAGRLGSRAWGVGILGFVPPDLRIEQLAVVREVRPSFALIAGGRPDQAAELEREGITTYLHVPSPALLDQYLRDGCRRFVLEGRECGGHVGPRSSFVLWEQATNVVADAIERGLAADHVNLVFAGGIHDARSAALVSALGGQLAARGVKLGVLLGTAYLFTREAVTAGAIVARFQKEVLRCDETVLLDSGGGHQVRVSRTPFIARFEQERQRLRAEGRSADEVRAALEALNVGRLRVATKGTDRIQGEGSPLVSVSEEYQEAHGLYMVGEVAALRSEATTIAELHREICTGGRLFLEHKPPRDTSNSAAADPQPRPSDVAVVGMAAVFPGAASVSRFWSNTLLGIDSITEVPPDRWDWRLYYDPDPKAPDKIVSKWGGFLPDVAFDPLVYGMPPSSLPSIEPAQLLALEVVRGALADAGYAVRDFPRERTAVVLGMGGGAAQLAMGYAFRSYLPMLDTVLPTAGKQAMRSCQGLLPEWTEDSFPGFLLNVTAGRIANRLNLGGANYTVDAACGSSLAAAALAVRELEAGAADVVVLGGVDTVQNPFTYLAFSKTQAFSPRGRCRPFDAGADGIVISEGVAALVLKRLADAERDGDRIYAVIKGIGASSDGRARGLTAPVVEGQIRALERAYAKAGVSPLEVGYVEAHGTGTALGDVVEVEALGRLFRAAGALKHQCVLGSVKSQIGHTKCAAGLAGLINASLSLYYKVLPPTIGIETPNPKLAEHDVPFRLCTQAHPWFHPGQDKPRRAGVSAFGFGGTNFHAVLEAYEGNLTAEPKGALLDWPWELFVWQARDPSGVTAQLDRLIQALDSGSRPHLGDLAHALSHERERCTADAAATATLAIVAADHDDLHDKLREARGLMAQGRASFDDPRGFVYAARPEWAGQRVAFVFPGQGSQAPGMLRELAVIFAEIRQAFEEFDRVVTETGGPAIGHLVFPPTAFDDTASVAARRALMATEVAQPAVGAACVGLLRVLRSLNCEPDMVAGHSFGELVALHAAGALSAPALAELAAARGRFMQEAARGSDGAMAALLADSECVAQLVSLVPEVKAANWNGPRQTVVAGTSAAVQRVMELAERRGIQARLLPVSCACHTSQVAGARDPLIQLARKLLGQAPDRPVYSNLDATPHPLDAASIALRLGDHLVGPVRFAEMIEAMYQAGARVFVEVGPGSVLNPLIEGILADRPHLAVACDFPGSSALKGWLRTIARLVAAGLPLRLLRLTRGRFRRELDLHDLPPDDRSEPTRPSTWLVNGSRARPLAGPEPNRLGVGPALTGPERDSPPVPTPVAAPQSLHSAGACESEANWNTDFSAAGAIAETNGTCTTPPQHSPTQALQPVSHTTMNPSTNPPPGAERVIESFQQTMQAFLDVQKSTMLAYLGGSAGSTAHANPRARRAPATGAAQKGAPAVGASRSSVNGLARDYRAMLSPTSAPASATPAETEITGWRRATLGDQRSDGFVQEAAGIIGSGEVAGAGTPHAGTLTAAPPVPDRTQITSRLLEIVRDRTGYPIETLGLGLDMEADLGIDSIKRVEILGKLRDEFPLFKGLSDSAEAMDVLARARTLGAIVEGMMGLVPASGPNPSDSLRPMPGVPLNSHAAEGKEGDPRASVIASNNGKLRHGNLRRLLEVVEAPLPTGQLGLMGGGLVLITDDDRGVAEHLAGHLERAGVATERLGGPESPIDWTSSSAIEAALDRARARGPLAGIVYARTMSQAPAGDGAVTERDSNGRIAAEVRGLFLLARTAAGDLQNAARAGGACLIGTASMGGRFASAGCTESEFAPAQGGIAGLVKTLAREWPAVRCRVVDFAPADSAEIMAQRLGAEVFADDGWAEVGYDRGRRIRLQTVVSPLCEGVTEIELKSDEPVIISGGARGITALVATELAKTWRPALLIVGTTPLPEERELPETADLCGEAEIKAALHDRLRRTGRAGSPSQIEAAFQSLRRVREVRENLAILRATGATVEYAQVDVCDPQALGKVLNGWRSRYGDPAGLIHGAGLIKDKLIREKTLESFDRVLATKLDGALNLLRLVRPEALKFTVLFSSIAGRFGNVGQTDYAAANEVLNKLAQWLDRRWPGRVLSLIWGPWSGVGMVSQLESHLSRRGLGLIAPELGRALLVDELRYGRKGDVEVIYAGGLGTLEDPIARAAIPEPMESVS